MIETYKDPIEAKVVEILLRDQCITSDVLEVARSEHEGSEDRLADFLVKSDYVTGEDLLLAHAEYLRINPIDLSLYKPDPDLVELLPSEILAEHLILPIARCGNSLTLALGDPYDVVGLESLRASTGMQFLPVVAPEAQVREHLHRFRQDATAGLEDILRDVDEDEMELVADSMDELALEDMLERAEDAPVIRIVNSILLDAIRKKASDIHIEPMEKVLRLRYRIDGMLYESQSPPRALHAAIVSRVKILSNLDIAERRVPQDGRLKIKVLGKEADVRVSTLPTVHGEKIVMRILDKSALAPSIASLGLDESAYKDFLYSIGQPYGMILVTGPTGSGKTTTLYSCLQELNKQDVNIVTVEDPVEYQLHGVSQVQVHSEIGLSFASGLRSILRQDPDIVLIGEMRDMETASIGVQAALTGHLVLSTLHTNDAAGAVSRLLYMGIEGFLLASSLLMTQAQRLYRKLCPTCKRPRDLPVEVLRKNHLNPDEFDGVQFFEPRGCPKCAETGFLGRAALMEILMIDDEIREAILRGSDSATVREMATRNGMVTMRDTGLKKVRAGETSIEEILRVTSGE